MFPGVFSVSTSQTGRSTRPTRGHDTEVCTSEGLGYRVLVKRALLLAIILFDPLLSCPRPLSPSFPSSTPDPPPPRPKTIPHHSSARVLSGLWTVDFRRLTQTYPDTPGQGLGTESSRGPGYSPGPRPQFVRPRHYCWTRSVSCEYRCRRIRGVPPAHSL